MSKSSSHEFETLSPLARKEREEARQLGKLPGLPADQQKRSIQRRGAFAGWYADQMKGMFPSSPRRDLDALPSPEEKISP